jgi:hypothetical protein
MGIVARIGTSRRNATVAACLGVFAILAVVLYLPTGPFDSTRMPDGGFLDPGQSVWNLGWTSFALSNGRTFSTRASSTTRPAPTLPMTTSPRCWDCSPCRSRSSPDRSPRSTSCCASRCSPRRPRCSACCDRGAGGYCRPSSVAFSTASGRTSRASRRRTSTPRSLSARWCRRSCGASTSSSSSSGGVRCEWAYYWGSSRVPRRTSAPRSSPISASSYSSPSLSGSPCTLNKVVQAIPTGSAVLSYPFPVEPWTQPTIWQVQDHMAFSLVGGIAYVREPDGVNGFSAPLLYPTYVQEFLAQEESAGFQPAYSPPGDAVGPTGTKALCQFLSLESVTAVLYGQVGAAPSWCARTSVARSVPRRSTTTECCSGSVRRPLVTEARQAILGRVAGLIARDGVSPRISERSRSPLGARPGDGRTRTCGAAWSARWPVKPEVAGSNPVRSAK